MKYVFFLLVAFSAGSCFAESGEFDKNTPLANMPDGLSFKLVTPIVVPANAKVVGLRKAGDIVYYINHWEETSRFSCVAVVKDASAENRQVDPSELTVYDVDPVQFKKGERDQKITYTYAFPIRRSEIFSKISCRMAMDPYYEKASVARAIHLLMGVTDYFHVTFPEPKRVSN